MYITVDVMIQCTYPLGFFIAQESPSVVIVSGFTKAVALYCLSSVHCHTRYKWRAIGPAEESAVFPSTPVIYVNQSGLFQCVLKYGSSEIEGSIIAVRVDFGTRGASKVKGGYKFVHL